MKRSVVNKIVFGYSLVLILLLALSTGLSAQEPDPVRPRPTVDPNGATSGQSTASAAGGPATSNNCAALYGTTLNWGVGGQGGIGINLGAGGWQAQQVTGDDGRYNFGALGIGAGILRVDPGLTGLRPIINDAAVRLSCDFATQAIIGLYSGDERPTPPAQIGLKASTRSAAPGDRVEFTLTVSNALPNPISQVIVTDLLPGGLTIKSVNASVGSVEVLDNKMLAVMIGDLPEGGTAEIIVSTQVGNQVTGGMQLVNTATLFYAESAADQASATIEVGSALATGPGETGLAVATTTAAASQAQAQGQGEAASTGTDDDADAPSPDGLPVTGFGATLSFPVVIIALIGLFVKGFHSMRSRPD